MSYYDYYQPESYVPRHDLYIEKQTDINEQIERLRIAAKAALLSRKDVIIVASVSCIYATGDPQTWAKSILEVHVGGEVRRETMLRRLVAASVRPQRRRPRAGDVPRARATCSKSTRPTRTAPTAITLFGDDDREASSSSTR